MTDETIDFAARRYSGEIPDARNTFACERWVAHYEGFKEGVRWAEKQQKKGLQRAKIKNHG